MKKQTIFIHGAMDPFIVTDETKQLSVFILVCSPEELARRIGSGVAEGRRGTDVLPRSLSRMERPVR